MPEQSAGKNHFESFPGVRRRPRRAVKGGAATQLHYARKGIITPEMEFVAIRENLGRERAQTSEDRTDIQFPAPGRILRSEDSRHHHSGICPRRSRPRPRHHSLEHQSPRTGADDHRPQLPREDQLEHRQQRTVEFDRGRSREDALEHQLGRRHGDGSLHRPQHPRDPRVDPAKLAGSYRHRSHLPGAGESAAAARRNSPGNSIAIR